MPDFVVDQPVGAAFRFDRVGDPVLRVVVVGGEVREVGSIRLGPVDRLDLGIQIGVILHPAPAQEDSVVTGDGRVGQVSTRVVAEGRHRAHGVGAAQHQAIDDNAGAEGAEAGRGGDHQRSPNAYFAEQGPISQYALVRAAPSQPRPKRVAHRLEICLREIRP